MLESTLRTRSSLVGILILTVLLLWATASFTVEATLTDDTYVIFSSISTNFGHAPSLKAANGTFNPQITYLRFDLYNPFSGYYEHEHY